MNDNRRRYPRFGKKDRLFAQVTSSIYQPALQGKTLPGKTLDISRHGMCIATVDCLPVGSRVDLWIDVYGSRGKYYLGSEVVWSRVAQNRGYLMGVELCPVSGGDFSNWEKLFDDASASQRERN